MFSRKDVRSLMGVGLGFFYLFLSFVLVPAAIAAVAAKVLHRFARGMNRKKQDVAAAWSAPLLIIIIVIGTLVFVWTRPQDPSDLEGPGLLIASLLYTGGTYFISSCIIGPLVAKFTFEQLRDE